MNHHDLNQLKGHQQQLLRIADALEAIHDRNPDRHSSGLLPIVAEMHDHQAKLADIIGQNDKRSRAGKLEDFFGFEARRTVFGF